MGKDGLVGLVLCGGASSRFGSDKAVAELDSVALVDHAIAQLKPLCARVVLIAGRKPHRFWSRLADGVEVSSDPGKGPAEALRYWLCDNPKPSLVVAVDMPRLRCEDLRAFVAAAGADCAILGDKKSTLPCLIDQRFLASDQASLKGSLKQINARRIDAISLGIDAGLMININHSDQLEE
jgi:molybdopterin-guanine dinucleotide biosynthesis protein A